MYINVIQNVEQHVDHFTVCDSSIMLFTVGCISRTYLSLHYLRCMLALSVDSNVR